jgi:sulfur-carrier protein
MIRVVLPPHLRTIAQTGSEVNLEVEGPVTQRSVLDALEARYPMLRGTIRDQVTGQRRPFLRFFACSEDLSHDRRIRRCRKRWSPQRSRSSSSEQSRAVRSWSPSSRHRREESCP